MCDDVTQNLCDTMTYEEFLGKLTVAELTVRDFALLIKRTPNAITNYASKEEVPAHIAIIATLCAHMHIAGQDYKAIISGIDFQGVKPRQDGKKGFRGRMKASDSGGAFPDIDMDQPVPY